jgi:murein DD-endopeptidase MepM/ murein hydrolase activator NlpD
LPAARRTEPPTARDRRHLAAPARPWGWAALALAAVPILLLATPAAAGTRSARPSKIDDRAEPVAGAFVYPVGDELDFTRPHPGESSGFIISDSYLVVRDGRHGQRTHKGVDLSNSRGGSPVRAIAAGVVVVADTKALIRVRKAQPVKVTRVVKGKRVVRWTTRVRTTTKWRTGWGNYVVIRHALPDGQTVHSLYGHLKPGSILVRGGDAVGAGEVIAQVGRTGRASSPHLHLEIRKSAPDPSAGDDFDPEDAESATVTDRTFALLATVDPVSFLEHHVRRFDDLDPRSWEARYALAACRDGILAGEGDRFDPDESITRADFYAALASTFGIARPGPAARSQDRSFASIRAALAAAGILNAGSARGEKAGDRLTRSDALELLLRCLDKSAPRGRSLASFERPTLCSDFNRVFAGEDAAVRADQQARLAALAETAAKRKAAEDGYARASQARKSAGVHARKRLKRPVVKPVMPEPRLDPGFEAIAQSDQSLSRAQACLLLASAFRAQHERASALERAAMRVATASSSGEATSSK